MNCDNRRIWRDYCATKRGKDVVEPLWCRTCFDRVTRYRIRIATGFVHKLLNRVTRVYTTVVEKKQAWDHASYCSAEWTRSKNSKSVLESEKKSSILTCLCRISEHYSRPSNESTKARNDVSGRSLSSATPSEYPCPECGISTLLLSHRAPFSYKVRPRNIFFYYTFFIEIVAPPKNGNKLSLA